MKNLIKLFFVAILAIVSFASCETANNEGGVPTIEIVEVKSSDNSITFAVTATNATECAYLLYDGDIVSASDVFENGTQTAASGVVAVKNLKAGNNNGGNDDQGGNGNIDIPEGALNITHTTGGRWYQPWNYYVTLVAETGERIILDFYTIDETMSSHLPYGSYELDLGSTQQPYTIGAEYSGIVLDPEQSTEEGYLFTSGYCSVDVVDGYYSLFFEFTYDVEGTEYSVMGYYNGPMSGTSVPGSDTDKRLIELLDVSSSSFSFRVNAESGQYWRCAVAEKIVYNSNLISCIKKLYRGMTTYKTCAACN